MVEVDIVRELLFIIVEVEMEPPRLEERVFVFDVNELGTDKFVIVAEVMVAFFVFRLSVLVVIKLEVEALEVEAFRIAKLASFPKITVK